MFVRWLDHEPPRPRPATAPGPDDRPTAGRRLLAELRDATRRMPWTRLPRATIHGAAGTGAHGEALGVQRSIFRVRLAGVAVAAIVLPLALRLDGPTFLAALVCLGGAVAVQAWWFRADRPELASAVATGALVADAAAAFLLGQAGLAERDWIVYFIYPLLAVEAALVFGPGEALAVSAASSVAYLVQEVERRGLGIGASGGHQLLVLSVFMLYGLFVAVAIGTTRRARGDLRTLLAVSTLLSQQESPTRLVQALDARLRELVGARIRSVAVRSPDGTYEVLRWRTSETRTIPSGAIAGLSAAARRDVEADMRDGRALTLIVDPAQDEALVRGLGLPEWVRSFTLVPIHVEGMLTGILPVLWDTPRVPTQGEMDLLRGLADQTGLAFGQAEATRARELAATDSLTGLANHRAFKDALEARLAESRRHRARFAVLFADLDRFKTVNDRHGHAVGDLLLHRVATAIRHAARAEDLVARYGGDELALILPASDRDAAAEVGRRLRDAVRSVENGMGIDLTVGVAVYPEDGDSSDILIARADAAMYAGKRLGGGRILQASEIPAEA